MGKGRKPQSPALKVLKGSRPSTGGPKAPPRALPACPDYLDGVAAEEWDRIVPELADRGVLDRVDRASLAIYCTAFSRWRAACDEIRVCGVVAATDQGGVKGNPAVAAARDAEALMSRLLIEFGGTPAARNRVSGQAEGPKDQLGEFLSRRNA